MPGREKLLLLFPFPFSFIWFFALGDGAESSDSLRQGYAIRGFRHEAKKKAKRRDDYTGLMAARGELL